jgi:hypothetical protein
MARSFEKDTLWSSNFKYNVYYIISVPQYFSNLILEQKFIFIIFSFLFREGREEERERGERERERDVSKFW